MKVGSGVEDPGRYVGDMDDRLEGCIKDLILRVLSLLLFWRQPLIGC